MRGTPTDFVETFHDEGMTDMLACMEAWHDFDFDGVLRPDHVPTLTGEPNDDPAYALLGRLHAIGYMQGLREAAARGKELGAAAAERVVAHEHPGRWAGIFPSIPTAFAGDGSLDLASQAAVARFTVDCGSQGLLCFGLAGEVFRLTPRERREALEVIVEAVAGRIPVLAGVGAEALHTSLVLAREARAAGADGVVIPPPVNTRPSRGELMRYFAEIATAADLPAMVQDAPEFLGVELGPELVLELARACPAVTCVKLEAGAERIAEWVAAAGDLAVFGGNAGLYMLDTLDQGAAGIAPERTSATSSRRSTRSGAREIRPRRAVASRVCCRCWYSSRRASSTTTPAPSTCSCAGACSRAVTCGHRRPV